MARLGGGVAGWCVGALPMVAINAASAANLIDTRAAQTTGVVILVIGTLGAGAVAGVIGSRGRGESGAASGGVAGTLTAVLSVLTLLGMMLSTAHFGIAPSVLTSDPIRDVLVILFLAALQILVAMGMGALSNRHYGYVSATQRRSALSPGTTHRPVASRDAPSTRAPERVGVRAPPTGDPVGTFVGEASVDSPSRRSASRGRASDRPVSWSRPAQEQQPTPRPSATRLPVEYQDRRSEPRR